MVFVCKIISSPALSLPLVNVSKQADDIHGQDIVLPVTISSLSPILVCRAERIHHQRIKSWPKHSHSRKKSSPNTLQNEKNDVSLSKELKKQAGTQSAEGPQEPSHDGRRLSSHLSDDAVPTRRLSHHLFLETSFPLR